MNRLSAAVAAFLISTTGLAQTTPTQQVELLAPQLLPFAGSVGNFESLVTGLTTGAPVTLVTTAADGSVQIVTFVPTRTLSPVEAARLLEAARQNLIQRGVATPNAQQLATSLVGGTITTLSGTSALVGVLSGTATPAVPVQVRLESKAPVANLSAADLRAVRDALITGSGTTARGVPFAPPGARLSEFEATQALQLAATLLAQQGIVDPTAEQLRAALFGGTLNAAGGSVALRGILEGQVCNTSDSRVLNTSASASFGTSNTPPQAPLTAGGPAGTPRPAGPGGALPPTARAR